MYSLQELSTRVAVLEQRMYMFEKSFEQYAKERKEQNDRIETKVDWVRTKVLIALGAIGVITTVAQVIIHFIK